MILCCQIIPQPLLLLAYFIGINSNGLGRPQIRACWRLFLLKLGCTFATLCHPILYTCTYYYELTQYAALKHDRQL